MPTSWFSSENFLRGLWPKFILSVCLSSPSYLSVCSSLFVFVCFSCRVRLLSVFAFYFFSILPKIFFLLLSLSWWSFGIVSSFHFWFQLTTLQAIFSQLLVLQFVPVLLLDYLSCWPWRFSSPHLLIAFCSCRYLTCISPSPPVQHPFIRLSSTQARLFSE